MVQQQQQQQQRLNYQLYQSLYCPDSGQCRYASVARCRCCCSADASIASSACASDHRSILFSDGGRVEDISGSHAEQVALLVLQSPSPPAPHPPSHHYPLANKQHSHMWPRFSQDFDALDGRGVIQIVFYYSTVANISVALLATLVVQPLLLVPLALSALAFFRVHSFFGAAAVEIRRLESACKAPMLAVSSFMFNGQPLLRAMAAQQQATLALSTSVDAWASMCVGSSFDVIRLNHASFDNPQVHTRPELQALACFLPRLHRRCYRRVPERLHRRRSLVSLRLSGSFDWCCGRVLDWGHAVDAAVELVCSHVGRDGKHGCRWWAHIILTI